MIIYCDGGSLNNQDSKERTAYGSFLLESDGSFYEYEYGNYTNNEAEYFTLLKALRKILSKNIEEDVIIKMDSKLVVNQVNGKWKCKQAHLQPLMKEAKNLIKKIEKALEINLSLEWVTNTTMKKKLGH